MYPSRDIDMNAITLVMVALLSRQGLMVLARSASPDPGAYATIE
jgi:hypothetical protein